MNRTVLLLLLAPLALACSSFGGGKVDPYPEPSTFLKAEIEERIANMPYLSGQRLVQNLRRLVYIGDVATPFLEEGLTCEHPQTRASCAWILGNLRDRRTLEPLSKLLDDPVHFVRYEAATAVCSIGDPTGYPVLIAGLSDEEIRNRYKAHEALQMLTKLDFGYHHDDEPGERRLSILKWQEWWTDLSAHRM